MVDRSTIADFAAIDDALCIAIASKVRGLREKQLPRQWEREGVDRDMSLLPSHHDEFRSKAYWDRFFLERGGEQFEWYGTFSELEGHVSRSAMHQDRILMIGCGNSEISADLYDSGYKAITNIDFSPLVIEEMISKNTYRPSMKWDVGDMTNMPHYDDGTFDIVFDKGALDALMSEDTAEVQEKAAAMFSEISRILTLNGKYICITLAEPYILRSLITYFTALKWKVTVGSVQNKKPSHFKPFYITITKTYDNHDVSLLFDSLGNDSDVSRGISADTAVEEIPLIQEYHQKRFELSEVRVGRFEQMDYMAKDGQGKHVGGVPRFSVTVVDVSRAAARSCVVFFIPPGRESEYQFSTQQGLTGIAAEAQCRRLLAVRCNKPHIFPAMQLLQEELSPIALSLKPRDMGTDEQIPYMALEADGNWETIEYGRAKVSGEYIVEEEPDENRPNGVTRRLVFLQNQNFIQTEVKMIEKKDNSKSSKSSSSKNTKKGKDKKKDKSQDGEAVMELDYNYLDDHHRAVLSCMVLTPDVISTGSKVQHTPHTQHTQSAENRAPIGLIIGLGGGAMPMCLQRYLPGMRLFSCEMDGEMLDIAVKFFAFKCNPRSHVIISEGMSLIERIHCAIKQGGVTTTAATAAVATTAAVSNQSTTAAASNQSTGPELSEPLDFLFIDADSKDPSLGLSAPPRAFITPDALKTFYHVLRPGGMLALNVVARTSSLLGDLVVTLKGTFEEAEREDRREETIRRIAGGGGGGDSGGSAEGGERERSKVYILKASDETANTTLIVIKGGVVLPSVDPKTAQGKKKTGDKTEKKGDTSDGNRLRIAREGAIEDWLKVINLPSDPLDLVSLVSKLQLA